MNLQIPQKCLYSFLPLLFLCWACVCFMLACVQMCIAKQKLTEAYNSFCCPVLPFSSLCALKKLSHGTWGKYRSHKVVMILLSMSYCCLNTPSSLHEFGGFELSSLILEASIFHIESLYLFSNLALNQKLKTAWNKLFNFTFLMPKKSTF